MPNESHLHPIVRRQISNLIDDQANCYELTSEPLQGGMEASGVTRVTARFRDRLNRPKVFKVVVKELNGRPAREADIYQEFVSARAAHIAPRLMATHRIDASRVLLFIEPIRKLEAWPWRSRPLLKQAMQDLGRFHAGQEGTVPALADWNYDAELSAISKCTLTSLDRCRSDPDLSPLLRHRRSVDRLTLALPELRRQLLSEAPFAGRPIHGDVHPGNALIARREGRNALILLDWGRARWGSPLEDISCWLQSLRRWEPAALRLHDTLLSAYLSAFGIEGRLTPQVRAAYWIASGSNALAGALDHHLCILRDERQSTATRSAAFEAACDCLRILRRAHAWTN